jgi:hypothetical protein
MYDFFYCFGLVIEGSGSLPLITGSGSWRLKNIWTRNTGFNLNFGSFLGKGRQRGAKTIVETDRCQIVRLLSVVCDVTSLVARGATGDQKTRQWTH